MNLVVVVVSQWDRFGIMMNFSRDYIPGPWYQLHLTVQMKPCTQLGLMFADPYEMCLQYYSKVAHQHERGVISL
jgi:hypothetical protein